MIVLDTDHLSLLQARDAPAAVALQARLEAFSPDEVVTTVITLEEQMRGWLALIHRVTELQRQVVYYERLLDLIAFFAEWEVLPSDQRAAVTCEHLRKRYGLPVDMGPVMDIARRYHLKVIEDSAEQIG
jgi:tRNA(fMet)-specific endonuclease VapC